MAVDTKKLFNEDLPAALAKNAEDAKTIGAKYQMNITGEGSWFIDVSATGPKCVPGEEPADCTITITSEDFQKLVENPQANGMQLFFPQDALPHVKLAIATAMRAPDPDGVAVALK